MRQVTTFSRSILTQNGNVTFLGSFTDVSHSVLNDLVVGPAAKLTVQVHNLNIGEGARVSGTFETRGGSLVNISEGLTVGPNAVDTARFEIRNPGSQVNVANSSAIIGQFGNGDLSVEDGAAMDVNGNVRIGFEGAGFALFDGQSTTLNVSPATGLLGQIVVGGNGFGVLDFFNNATGNSTELIVVENGILDLINGGSLATESTDIGGIGSTAFVNIFSGGQLLSGTDDTVIGNAAESCGSVRVSDAGSLWLINGPIDIGRFGTGELIVENGGEVESIAGISAIGAGENGDGLLEVKGVGSSLSMRNLDVGLDGNGVLRVLAGASRLPPMDLLELKPVAGLSKFPVQVQPGRRVRFVWEINLISLTVELCFQLHRILNWEPRRSQVATLNGLLMEV